MILTENEAKFIINSRVRTKFWYSAKKRIHFFALSLIVFAFATFFLISSDSPLVNYYDIPKGGAMELKGDTITVDGNDYKPIGTEGGPDYWIAGIGLVLFISSLILLGRSAKDSEKDREAAIAQYEKDGTLPPIPPETIIKKDVQDDSRK